MKPDPYLPLRNLRQCTNNDEHLVAEGEVAVQRFLLSGWPVQTVLLTPSKAERLGPYLRPEMDVQVLSTTELSDIVGFAMHRGVIACGPMPALCEPFTFASDAPRTVIIAERLADPRNMGALIRNARALGADALVCDTQGAHPLSRQAIRAAMGHGFTLPLWRMNPQAALQQLRAQLPGLQVVAASAAAQAIPITEHPWGHHVALLVGQEGDGLSEALLAEACAHVTIPMHAEVDSLNVAAASAVFLHTLHTARRDQRSAPQRIEAMPAWGLARRV